MDVPSTYSNITPTCLSLSLSSEALILKALLVSFFPVMVPPHNPEGDLLRNRPSHCNKLDARSWDARQQHYDTQPLDVQSIEHPPKRGAATERVCDQR